MKQPDLGKKISELRLAKGLTQGELASKCNLSLRTIQRIESAEVTPRSYTMKLIFSNLDYEIYNSFGKFTYKLDRIAYRLNKWLGQCYRYVLDLFNLKTNTMKKITILLTPFILLTVVLLMPGFNVNAQNDDKIKASIDQVKANFVKSFNAGQLDSAVSIYLENASLIPADIPEISGREDIKGYYRLLYLGGERLEEDRTSEFIITENIVIEKGSVHGYGGNFMTLWRLVDGEWYIENEIISSDSCTVKFVQFNIP